MTFNVVPLRSRPCISTCNYEKNVEEGKITTRKDKILRCNSPPLIILKCYYDQKLMSSLSHKRFLFSLSEVAVPVSVIEMNFGAL